MSRRTRTVRSSLHEPVRVADCGQSRHKQDTVDGARRIDQDVKKGTAPARHEQLVAFVQHGIQKRDEDAENDPLPVRDPVSLQCPRKQQAEHQVLRKMRHFPHQIGQLPDEKIKEIEEFVGEVNPEATVISTVFRPKPLEDISGKKVLFATTAPEDVKDKLVEYLQSNYDCEIIGTTSHLSNRPLLREDMKKYMDQAEVMLTELKAAAVDVATKDAIAEGLEVVYCDNIPVPINDSYPDLKASVLKLVDSAIDDFDKSS